MNPKTRAQLIAGIAIVAVMVVCLLGIRLANHSLTAAGSKRLKCPDGDYAWVSNDRIVTFLAKTATVPARYDRSTQVSVINITAELTDIAEGSHRNLSEFHSQLPEDHASDIALWTVSPDGKRLIYGPVESGRDYEDETDPLSMWNMDSSEGETIDPDVYAGIDYFVLSATWMPDSSPLFIAKGDGGSMAAVYNTESREDSSIAVPLALQAPTALGVTPNNHLVYTNNLISKPGVITIYEQYLYKSQSPPGKYMPILPPGAAVNELSLSPQGTRLAWITSSIYTPPGYRIMKKIVPWLAKRNTPYPVVSIYVSRLNGTGMRLLGMENNPPNQPDEVVRNVRWSPDGKFLSFRWRKGVYLVPAE